MFAQAESPTPHRKSSSIQQSRLSKQPKLSPQLPCHCSKKDQIKPSFSPQVRELPYSVYPQQWSKSLTSNRERWEKLTQNNRERNQTRIQENLRCQNQKYADCTFTTASSRQLKKNGLNNQSLNQTFQRLYSQAQKRKEQSIQNEKAVQAQQLNSQPVPKSKSSKYTLNKQKLDLSPLYLRLQQVLKQQAQNRKLAIKQQEIEHPFKPQLNKHSEEIVKDKNTRIANIVDRLIDEHQKTQERLQQTKAKYEKLIDKELTFQPKISQNIITSPTTKRLTDRQRHNYHKQYTFQPTINQMSLLLTQQNQYETTQEQLFRLHSAPIIKKQEKIALLEAQAYEQYTFNPEINSVSQALANPCKHQHQCQTPKKQVYSHRPNINSASRILTPAQRYQTNQKSKKKVEEKIEQYKRQSQYTELKECSFKPVIIERQAAKSSAKAQSLKNVAGCRKFLAQAQNAKMKEEQRKKLEQKLFNLEKAYDERCKRKIFHKGSSTQKHHRHI